MSFHPLGGALAVAGAALSAVAAYTHTERKFPLERVASAAVSAAGEDARRECDVPSVTLTTPSELLEVALENLVGNATS